MANKAPPRAPAPRTPAAPPAPAPGADRAHRDDAPPPTALALVTTVDNEALAALQAAGIDVSEDTSCEELRPSDFKTAAKLFNMKGKTPGGLQRRQDRFYDSITGAEQETIEFAILGLHKSNTYGVYDNGEGRTNRVCSSFDQIVGTWAEDGHSRQCEGCPDKRATKQPDGKVRSNCTEVVDLMCLELDTTGVFMLRGKRTSRPPMMNYLHQHHFGKGGSRNGKRLDMPLFAYRVTASLEMDASGNYANLVLTKGEMFSPNDLKVLSESSKGVRETLAERLAEAEAQTNAAESGGGGSDEPDASFNYGAGAEPTKFVNTPGAA